MAARANHRRQLALWFRKYRLSLAVRFAEQCVPNACSTTAARCRVQGFVVVEPEAVVGTVLVLEDGCELCLVLSAAA